MKKLLFCILLLCGCTAKPLPLPQQSIRPIQAQFGLNFAAAGMTIPLQGAIQMAEQEGSLGVIFPHGRTLGICTYHDQSMECTPAESASYEGMQTNFMLRQIGLAVYRLLPSLTQQVAEDTLDKEWLVYWKETDSGWKAKYRDLPDQVLIEIYFTEIFPQ